MQTNKKISKSTQAMVLTAILTALVILLQWLGSFIKVGPFSISLVLLPIVIGAATCGIGSAAWLGLVFGSAVLLFGDAAPFLAVNVPGTFVTVLGKGMACGACAGLSYRLIRKATGKSVSYVAVMAAAIVCAVVNTGVFLLGCNLFFMDAVTGWAQAAGLGDNVGRYMIVGLVGINFLIELAVNVVFGPIVTRLLRFYTVKH